MEAQHLSNALFVINLIFNTDLAKSLIGAIIGGALTIIAQIVLVRMQSLENEKSAKSEDARHALVLLHKISRCLHDLDQIKSCGNKAVISCIKNQAPFINVYKCLSGEIEGPTFDNKDISLIIMTKDTFIIDNCLNIPYIMKKYSDNNKNLQRLLKEQELLFDNEIIINREAVKKVINNDKIHEFTILNREKELYVYDTFSSCFEHYSITKKAFVQLQEYFQHRYGKDLMPIKWQLNSIS